MMLIEGFDHDKLLADKRTYYSVMKNIEIVGEAAYMLTKAFKRDHPTTPWKFIQGMRHVLVHEYANVVSATLYDTAVNDIPLLRKQVEQYLAETDWQSWESEPNEFDDSDEDKVIKVARRMKSKGYTNMDIADITGLNSEDIERL